MWLSAIFSAARHLFHVPLQHLEGLVLLGEGRAAAGALVAHQGAAGDRRCFLARHFRDYCFIGLSLLRTDTKPIDIQ